MRNLVKNSIVSQCCYTVPFRSFIGTIEPSSFSPPLLRPGLSTPSLVEASDGDVSSSDPISTLSPSSKRDGNVRRLNCQHKIHITELKVWTGNFDALRAWPLQVGSITLITNRPIQRDSGHKQLGVSHLYGWPIFMFWSPNLVDQVSALFEYFPALWLMIPEQFSALAMEFSSTSHIDGTNDQSIQKNLSLSAVKKKLTTTEWINECANHRNSRICRRSVWWRD